jgi:hypothetical protein
MSGALALARAWVNDYFNRHDAAAARAICAPDYTLRIGDVVFAGRDDAWLPAVDAQFAAWPGLGMTVHRTACGPDWAAVWFSEHGASRGRAAVWSGVAIYAARDGRLQGCVAQEDYFTRRRQVTDGRCDPVDPPCAAPWDAAAEPPAPGAAEAVRDWLAGGWPGAAVRAAVRADDDHITGRPLRFDVEGARDAAFHVSGDWVAFTARQHGTYRGGLPDADRAVATTLDVNGLVRVQAGRVAEGRVIRDRMGLWARVRGAA